MKKRLFARYFTDGKSQIPTDSWPVSEETKSLSELKQAIDNQAYNVMVWMIHHPDGKVDFVWL
jgi:hypothetical protein